MKNLFKTLSYFSVLALLTTFCSCDPLDVISNGTKGPDSLDYVYASKDVVKITFDGSIIKCDHSSRVTISGNSITIKSSGTYSLNGTLNDGQVIVESIGIVRLILNNVTINNTTTSPIFVKSAPKTILILPENTVNTISDSKTHIMTKDSLNAAIFSKGYLSVYGTGKLTVNGNYDAAIHGKDGLVIESGNLYINSVGYGIKGKDYLLINGGNFEINTKGDGLKSDIVTVKENKGYVRINNGNFKITSSTDGISASQEVDIVNGTFDITSGGGSSAIPDTSISAKGIKGQNISIQKAAIKINSSDNSIDAKNNLRIESGTFSLSTASKAITSDSTITINGGNINILKSEKGIKSHTISINGGTSSVYSSNDCVKATLGDDLTTDDGSVIEVNGGSVGVRTDKGDSFDSNGNIKINGGLVVVQGSPTSPDDAFTYRNTFSILGGQIVASGGATMNPSTSSSQNTVVLHLLTPLSSSSYLTIQDTNGNTVMTFKAVKYAYYILISLPTLTNGATYNIYKGGSITGSDFNGFYQDNSYTPGTKAGSFTITSKLTSVQII